MTYKTLRKINVSIPKRNYSTRQYYYKIKQDTDLKYLLGIFSSDPKKNLWTSWNLTFITKNILLKYLLITQIILHFYNNFESFDSQYNSIQSNVCLFTTFQQKPVQYTNQKLLFFKMPEIVLYRSVTILCTPFIYSINKLDDWFLIKLNCNFWYCLSATSEKIDDTSDFPNLYST